MAILEPECGYYIVLEPCGLNFGTVYGIDNIIISIERTGINDVKLGHGTLYNTPYVDCGCRWYSLSWGMKYVDGRLK